MKIILVRLVLGITLLAIGASARPIPDGSNPYPPMCPNGPGGPCLQ